jgi:hypothetical protein
MSDLNRREALRALLRGALGAGGTVVLATAVLPAAAQATVVETAAATPRARADGLATAAGQEAEEFCKFANGAFVNGGFRNAGTHPVGPAFANHAAGGVGTFANAGTHPVGGFNNGAFRNAGFRNY